MAPKQLVRGASHSSWTITDITFDHIPNHAFTISTTTINQTITPSALLMVILLLLREDLSFHQVM